MTFSIVARCPRTGQLGIAAATGMPGVGKLLTYAYPGAGAAATQAWINPYLGIDAVALMRDGRSAAGALQEVLAGDEARDCRQVGLVDAEGGVATWTGKRNSPWAGHRVGDGFTVQGNLLTGPGTVDASWEAFEAGAELDLAERLMQALEAGERAGGDRRGTRSATIYVIDSEAYPLWDIRVDEHRHPYAELRRMFDVFARELVPHIRRMPSRAHPTGQGELDREDAIA